MNKKRIGIIIWIVIVFLLAGFGFYFFFIKQDQKSTLTIVDKKWIEDNKNNVIDVGIVNDVPVFSYEGSGVFFSLLQSIEDDTGLEFNGLSYNLGSDMPSDYAFQIVDSVDKNDILLYSDYYSLITKENVRYNALSDIKAMTIGVLESDLENANNYLKENSSLSFKTYSDVNKLNYALTSDEVGGILLPKTICLKETAKVGTLYNSYNVTEMQKYIVLHLGNNKKLNQIIEKYYKKWSQNNMEILFNSYFSIHYFAMNNVSEQDDAQFRSKSYTYGFVDVAPFDASVGGSFVGTNKEVIKAFAKNANIDIKYKEFNNIEEMTKAFNENKIDFMFDQTDNKKYDMDVVNTVSIYNEKVAIISSLTNHITVNSLSSLRGRKVHVIKSSKIAKELKDEGAELVLCNSMSDLLNKINSDSIVALDYKTYEVYSRNKLASYKIDYMTTIGNEYSFVIRDISDNMVFKNYFNFYLTFMNKNDIIDKVNYKTFNVKISNATAFYILIAGIIILFISFGVLLYSKTHTKKHKKSMGRESKLRYIDMLTSLKNRNYLNDSMTSWDESEIYPQSIIIIDLNNVAYINDNYGHEEGDKVIAEAANILIKSQIENSEIIRTNGNEFLIYLVSYEEKQVVSYIRKLNKEFKDLSHGFGAAIGYSMIMDGIKTIDDAINEATLDMKSNKEEANN